MKVQRYLTCISKHREFKYKEMVHIFKNAKQCLYKNVCWFMHGEHDHQNIIQTHVPIVETLSKKVSIHKTMTKTLSEKMGKSKSEK